MEDAPRSSRQPLAYVDVAEALCARPHWALVDRRLVRTADCGDWDAAYAAVRRIAAEAERLDHHPDWSQQGGVLRIAIRTHRPAGISALDLALADAVDVILGDDG